MEQSRFSSSGEFFSACGADGRLRIWETKDKSSTLKQEFVPSSHLSALCTSIEWAPTGSSFQEHKRKRKKRVLDGDLIALGTSAGSLLIYSYAKSELVAHTPQIHSGQVTGLAWSPTTLSLCSCGEDGYIVEWDVENGKSIGRWKGSNKGPLTAVCMFKDMLLAAGRGITLWDLETRTMTKTFMGQASLISRIEAIAGTDYFITMSLKEMYLQIWSKSERNAVATLMLSEYPKSFSVVSSGDGYISVGVVTEGGFLNTFQHKLNGPLRKPLSPHAMLKIADIDESSAQIPILAAFLTQEESNSEVKLAYGSWVSVRFESMVHKYLQDTVTIKRKYSFKSKDSKNKKVEEPDSVTEVPSDAKHLQPGSEANLKLNDAKSKKRKKKSENKEEGGELPMEDRLSNLTIDKRTSGTIPDGSNLAHLLSQGLHSKDGKILQSVLSRWDQDTIENTVRSLPVQMIVPLLNEMKKFLSNKPMLNHSILKWLKTIFKIHSSFLMACPSSEDLFGTIISVLHSRETLYPQMCQLKGKLELVKGNIQSKDNKADIPDETLLTYHDESSDEGEEEDMIPSESEEFVESDELIDDDDEKSGGSDSEGSDSSGNTENIMESDLEDKVGKIRSNKKRKTTALNGTVGSDESMEEDE